MIGSLLGYKLGGVCAREGARHRASVRVSKKEREREVAMICSLLGYKLVGVCVRERERKRERKTASVRGERGGCCHDWLALGL